MPQPRTLLVAAVLAVAVLSGCAATPGSVSDEEVAGTNRPTETPQTTESTSEAPPAPTNPKFGETWTYEDGLSVVVSAPQPFTPAEYAYVGEPRPAAFVVFDVTVVNGSTVNYEPGMFSATMQSANVEAQQVFDSENGVGGSPTTVLLPGREAAFRMAFGAADPADLVLQVRPGFDYESVVYTS